MIHVNPGLGVTSTQPRIRFGWTQADLQAMRDAAAAKQAAQMALESEGGLPTIAYFVIGAAVLGGAAWFIWLRK